MPVTGRKELGRFQTFDEWVIRTVAGSRRYPIPVERIAFIDGRGRECLTDADFVRARDDNAFPVTFIEKKGSVTDER